MAKALHSRAVFWKSEASNCAGKAVNGVVKAEICLVMKCGGTEQIRWAWFSAGTAPMGTALEMHHRVMRGIGFAHPSKAKAKRSWEQQGSGKEGLRSALAKRGEDGRSDGKSRPSFALHGI